MITILNDMAPLENAWPQQKSLLARNAICRELAARRAQAALGAFLPPSLRRGAIPETQRSINANKCSSAMMPAHDDAFKGITTVTYMPQRWHLTEGAV